MKIHEYQGKDLFRKYGIAVPRGIPAFSVEEAVKAAKDLGGPVWVVKAQIHAGGRGKGGGVKLARSMDEVKSLAGTILGMAKLVLHRQGGEMRDILLDQDRVTIGRRADHVLQRADGFDVCKKPPARSLD